MQGHNFSICYPTHCWKIQCMLFMIILFNSPPTEIKPENDIFLQFFFTLCMVMSAVLDILYLTSYLTMYNFFIISEVKMIYIMPFHFPTYVDNMHNFYLNLTFLLLIIYYINDLMSPCLKHWIPPTYFWTTHPIKFYMYIKVSALISL